MNQPNPLHDTSPRAAVHASAVQSAFERMFGRAPEAYADAPGRVNLIGEHTDYSGGFVLPTAIPQRTRIAVGRRADRIVRAFSAQVSPEGPSTFELGKELPRNAWIDYVQGVVVALRSEGHGVSGFDAYLQSDVPVGAGLSSSAALEVALLRALAVLFDLPLDPVAMARLGRRAENDFVGAPVGIMDQMAASLASVGVALFLDTRTLRFQSVPVPRPVELLVIDSGVAHAHATGEYRTRRDECARAATWLGVHELRDVSSVDGVRALPPPLDRRARHVVSENARVLRAVEALRRGEVETLGEVLRASHASLRDDFEVTTPDLDRLVQTAERDRDVLAARMTGGGFGGSIVALARAGRAAAAGQRIARDYDGGGKPRARVLVPMP
jgi:galactokinase